MVQIYHACVDSLYNEDIFHKKMSLLYEGRIAKAKSYRQKADQVRCVAAGLLLIASLEVWLKENKLPPLERDSDGKVTLREGSIENGKPFLIQYPQFHFNLSHSGNHVLCASSNQPVGIDIQERGKIKEGVIKRFFSEREQAFLEEVSDWEKKEKLFFQIWAAKESYVKWTGLGMKQNFADFTANTEQGTIENLQNRVVAYCKNINACEGYTAFICDSEPNNKKIIDKIDYKINAF